jgi:hypothetical protein
MARPHRLNSKDDDTVSARMPAAMADELHRVAKAHDLTASQLVRSAVREKLAALRAMMPPPRRGSA